MTPTVREGLEPFFPGLFDFGNGGHESPRLIASRCPECRRHAFPAKSYCPYCCSSNQQKVALSGLGRVYAFTHVKQPPKAMGDPYIAAYVDLDESVRLFAQIDAPPDQLSVGSRVRVVFGALRRGDPGLFGYWFVPTEAS